MSTEDKGQCPFDILRSVKHAVTLLGRSFSGELISRSISQSFSESVT
jgi:hypothetical protein